MASFYYFVLNIYNSFFGHTAYSIRLFHIIFGSVNIFLSFFKFYREVIRLNYGKKADLVFASSSRLFTFSASNTILFSPIKINFIVYY